MPQTPKQLGFTMPGEWERHSGIWLSWPYDEISFTGRMEETEDTFCKIIRALFLYEQVNLILKEEPSKLGAIEKLKRFGIDTEKLNIYVTEYVDIWTRDYCPTFLVNRQTRKLGAVHWRYNGYGMKFPDLAADDEVARKLKNSFGADSWFEADIFTEGGALEVNGKGTVIVTEQCLLNKNRNPNLTKNDVEKILGDYLGVSKVIWIKEGLVYDPTDGHIDDFIKFADEHTVMCAYEDDQNHRNYQLLEDAYQVLLSSTDQDGRPFKIIRVPMPEMEFDRPIYFGTTVAPVSYINFYIGNETILIPTYGHKNDAKAVDIISRAFFDRKPVIIDCRELIYGGGSIHCVTQQVPLI